MRRVDLTGQTIGSWLIISVAPRPARSSRTNGTFWYARCPCGEIEIKHGGSLRAGRIRELCAKCQGPPHVRSVRPGICSPTYNTWRAMRARCLDPKDIAYPRYGGRGIVICDEWRDDFIQFLADMGERPQGMTIDRKNTDGPYSPDNCRWADSLTQARNNKNFKITDDQIIEIRGLIATGMIARKIADIYGVSRSHIANIKVGRARTRSEMISPSTLEGRDG